MFCAAIASGGRCVLHARVCTDANRAAVAAAGGIEAVVAVLRRHEGTAAMAEKGCWALTSIAWLGECTCAEQLRTRLRVLRCDYFGVAVCCG